MESVNCQIESKASPFDGEAFFSLGMLVRVVTKAGCTGFPALNPTPAAFDGGALFFLFDGSEVKGDLVGDENTELILIKNWAILMRIAFIDTLTTIESN